MKPTLPLGILASLLFLTSIQLFAQNDGFAYAITDETKEGSNWKVLRKINLKTGEYTPVLFDGMKANSTAFDASSKKQLIADLKKDHTNLPFNTGVAALALDRKHNRLYFTPMFINQLRYIDLSSMKVYFITDQIFSPKTDTRDGSKTVSRMVITPDGTGYAISNDASSFIQFTTGKKPVIKQLGALVNDPANNGVSVHNSCSSFGGDIVTDEKGMLFLVTGRNNVFKINPATKLATHLGSIKGLPAEFTTNAAVVMDDGKLLVSSAVSSKSNYLVDIKNWQASPFHQNVSAYHTSDLANSNYLSSTGKKRLTQIESLATIKNNSTNHIQLYPNPVADNAPFNIQFNNLPTGQYHVQIIDVNGHFASTRKVTIGAGKTTQLLPMTSFYAKGLYMVRVINPAKKTVFEQKLMVQ